MEDIIQKRSSINTLEQKRQISFRAMSNIMHYSYGIKKNKTINSTSKKRHCPSGGGIYPLEIFIYAGNIEKLKKGCIYYFNSYQNNFSLVFENINLKALENCFLKLNKRKVTAANCILFIYGNFNKSISKYHNRGYRLMNIEAGHLGQNILLNATHFLSGKYRYP
ncbi:MAG: SagB family peptide dehydrogenase [Chitinophagaceae bacterium]|nr:SagB family peptide dehydrogenase [Chitinophagaceae bacterium]